LGANRRGFRTQHLANFSNCEPYRFGSDFRFVDLNLLQYLYLQAAAPEYPVCLKWRPDTAAFRDKRAEQHYAVQDDFPAVRHVQRAIISSNRPV